MVNDIPRWKTSRLTWREISGLPPGAQWKLTRRSLPDDEEVSVMALDPNPAPSGEARGASAERLRGALDQFALKAQDGADGEVDDAVDEAMNHIRPRRT
jgi:hypothetical protein